MGKIFMAFIPICVAVDALGVLPIYISLTQGMDKKIQNKIIRQSILTASLLAFGFIFLGKFIFRILGITIADFMIAGGLILFCIALLDILKPGKQRRYPPDDVGAVPIGTPLITGPAVLTTSLVMMDQYGWLATVFAVLANVILAGCAFYSADFLVQRLGLTGIRAFSKVMALLLAAIAVEMIRKGVLQVFSCNV
jgi:multiple antibiotic resistance protein